MAFVIDYNCITPIGGDVNETLTSVAAGRSGISAHSHAHLGRYYASHMPHSGLEVLLEQVLQPLVKKYSVGTQDLLLLSTTKGEITALENESSSMYLSTIAWNLARKMGFELEPWVISNACVSGLQALAVANRIVEAGLYGRVFVVAGDLVTDFVLSGFGSFQALADEPCRPYDAARTGVNLGEAVAAALISTTPSSIKILGEGAINDANHISGPSRTGEGLYRSIALALEQAGLHPSQLDYISAHGTATVYNDEMESIAFHRSGLQEVPLNSLKGYFGHTLGAAGLLECIVAFESAKKGVLYPSLGYTEHGVTHDLNVIQKSIDVPVHYFMKTASGFGGCNTAVIFEHVHTEVL
jgi:3-oxoacyl-[acyl-carrier-protein] synthase-1